MFCMKCGKEMPDDAKTCPNCGQEVDAQFHSHTDSPKTAVDADDIASTASSDTPRKVNYANPLVCLREVYIKKFFKFSGRASRSEFWFYLLYFIVALIVVGIAGTILSALIGGEGGVIIFYVLYILLALANFFPSLALSVRRLHDLNHSGLWMIPVYIAGVIPFLDFIVSIGFLVFMCLKGTTGSNRFGEDPLA